MTDITVNTETPAAPTKGAVAKKIAKFVAIRSVSGTVVTLIHQNTKTFSTSQKAQLYIGAYLVGSVVAERAWDEAEKTIDEISSAVRTLRQKDVEVEVEITDKAQTTD